MDLYPIRLDVSKLSFPVALAVLSPALPGGVLLAALYLSHQNYVLSFFRTSPLGYYANVFCLAGAGYISGFVLMMIVESAASMFWLGVNRVSGLAITRQLGKPWESPTFRRAATQFLGQAAPSHVETFNPALENIKNISINLIHDPVEKAKALSDAQKRGAALSQSDYEWTLWYQTLKAYFGLPNQAQFMPVQICGILHSVGWAGLALLIAASSRSALLYSASIASILIGFVLGTFWGTCLYGGFGSDPLGPAVTASLLRENASRSASKSESNHG